MPDPRHWVATISADHAARALQGGILQACHGKRGPLARMAPGDGVVIYSPRQSMAAGPPVQAFTAIGRVAEGAPYLFDMGGGFVPHRRAVIWQNTGIAPIRPLLETLELTRVQPNWGMAFRFGHREISRADFALIARAMLAAPAAEAAHSQIAIPEPY